MTEQQRETMQKTEGRAVALALAFTIGILTFAALLVDRDGPAGPVDWMAARQ